MGLTTRELAVDTRGVCPGREPLKRRPGDSPAVVRQCPPFGELHCRSLRQTFVRKQRPPVLVSFLASGLGVLGLAGCGADAPGTEVIGVGGSPVSAPLGVGGDLASGPAADALSTGGSPPRVADVPASDVVVPDGAEASSTGGSATATASEPEDAGLTQSAVGGSPAGSGVDPIEAPSDAGAAGASVCVEDGSPCLVAADCCSGYCGPEGTCSAATTCKPVGESCSTASECCSGVCLAAGSGKTVCRADASVGSGSTEAPGDGSGANG